MHERTTTWVTGWFRRILKPTGLGSRPTSRVITAGVLLAVGVVGVILIGSTSSVGPDSPSSHEDKGSVASPLASLQKASSDDSLWVSQSQRARTWQVAKMNTLGQLLARFPEVDGATVLLEPADRGGLGRVATPATAAVHLTLARGVSMDRRLLQAVTDLLVGSEPNLSADAVRVIDGVGRSYRLDDKTLPGDTARQREKLSWYQEQLRGRICEALSYIPDLAVTVEALTGKDGTTVACRAVRLSAPRQYFESMYRECGAEGSGPDHAVLDSIIATETVRIRELVGTLVQAPAEHVTVDWHYRMTTPAKESLAAAPVVPANTMRWRAGVVWVLVCLELWVLATWVIRRTRVRRYREAWSRARTAARRRKDRSVGAIGDRQPFAAIRQVEVADLISLLREEPGETAALVLSHLAPERAAKVLAGLGGRRQIDIARHIASLGEVDRSALLRAERHLAHRLTTMERQRSTRADGVATVTRILQHAGLAGRRKVLQALHEQAPGLAATIGRQLVGFEDLAEMSAAELGGALQQVDSEQIALALWAVGEPLRSQVLSSLSEAHGETVRKQMQRLGPVRLSRVEAAQRHVVRMVRGEEANELATTGFADDDDLLA